MSTTPAPTPATGEKPSLLTVLTSPRVWLMLTLGFSSGLPLYLTGSTLSVWMKNEGLSLKTIGVFSLVGMAYSSKFLWAPLMDRFTWPFLGRRRGWLLVTQVLVAAGLFAMAQVNPSENLYLMAVLAACVAFASASQDIVADAYRTDLLKEAERGFGVATFLLGYRVAFLLVAQSLALILSELIGWRPTYMIMGGLMCVGVIATLLAREPESESAPRSLSEAVVQPFMEFFKRGWPAFLAMAFILLFRVGDAVAYRMATPFVVELGFSNIELGTIQKFSGTVGAIAGSLVGGLLLAKLGVKRSLALFGAAQAATNLLYVALAARGKDPTFLAFTVGADNFTGGMGSAALTVFITALCNRSFSATQYALLSSLSSLPMNLLGASSGFLQAALGWNGFFTMTAAAMVPAILLLLVMPKGLGVPKPAGASAPLPESSGTPQPVDMPEHAARKSAG